MALLVLNSTATPGGRASGKRLVVDNGALKAAALRKKTKQKTKQTTACNL